jgi:hypothetical protein
MQVELIPGIVSGLLTTRCPHDDHTMGSEK